jgi:hypothetical protein
MLSDRPIPISAAYRVQLEAERARLAFRLVTEFELAPWAEQAARRIADIDAQLESDRRFDEPWRVLPTGASR